ncbi:hypothetical protein [Streptomyces sp. NPDC020742]|uniref:hypothetical protein n=1 Tax=Streptomyces sp. NPDC020742 TaxID=3154897 RepID=UPI0033CFF11D
MWPAAPASTEEAVNPCLPLAHRSAQVVRSVDETGRTVVHLAEGRDTDTQLGHLSPDVAVELAWQSPVQAPPRRPVAPPAARRTAT